MIWTVPLFLDIGDLRSADEHANWLISLAEAASLRPYAALGRGYKAVVAIRRGDVSGGVASIRACLEQLHALRYELLSTELRIALAQGLVAMGQIGEGIAQIDETIGLIEANGDFCYIPEALRVKGGMLLAIARPNDEAAESCFTRSMEWSRRQGARAWELRAATDLAALFAGRGEPERARAILRPVIEQFEEGLDTVDLKAAQDLLAMLD